MSTLPSIGIAITGSGSAAPAQFLDNETLSQVVETSDEWIATRTGIKQRYLATPTESIAQLAAKAAQKALEMSNLDPDEVDLLILASSTPDDLYGSACQIQAAIGAKNAVAFDLTAACSGFVFAMVTAAQFLRNGVYRNAIVIGADIHSRWVDWSDRTTCVLFGDGAGAIVMQATTAGDRFLGFEIRSDGTQNDCLNLPYQGVDRTLTGEISISQGMYKPMLMRGKEVYKFAVSKVPEVLEKALFRSNLTINDVDWLLLHQANQRILDAVAQRLNIPSAKVISNLARYGNTSAASIPIALDEAVREGKIRSGEAIATAGFGAGLSWGAAIFRWGAF
jgi:3-oxoacyl-[acyl-carrier-protein] synthase III